MKRCLACDALFENRQWKCAQCGYEPLEQSGILRFAADPSDTHAGYKPEYFAKLAGFEEEHFWFRSRNQLIQWALQSYFPEAETFFEIGCGTGFVLKGLCETRPRLRMSGSEIFGAGLLFARARLPEAELYQMDARQIPFVDEFDVIGAFDVLEHIAEDDLVLTQMFKATRPGGGILVTVPQHPGLWSASDEHAMHERRYRCGELRMKVDKAGFVVKHVTSFVTFLLPLMIASRMKNRRSRQFDLWAEFRVSRTLNVIFSAILSVERVLIKTGVSLPAGGSLLLIGEKPATAL